MLQPAQLLLPGGGLSYALIMLRVHTLCADIPRMLMVMRIPCVCFTCVLLFNSNAGHRIERETKYIPMQHYQLMLLCWDESESKRPTFDALCLTFADWADTPGLDQKGDWLIDKEGNKVKSGLLV